MDWDKLSKFIADEELRLRKRFEVESPGTQWYLAHFVKLSEEVGELAEQVLAHQSLQRKDKEMSPNDTALADEVADVLICTLIIAHDLEVDVPEALKRKIAKIEARYQK